MAEFSVTDSADVDAIGATGGFAHGAASASACRRKGEQLPSGTNHRGSIASVGPTDCQTAERVVVVDNSSTSATKNATTPTVEQ